MRNPELEVSFMKVLATKHFPLSKPRRKVKIAILLKAVARFGTDATLDEAYLTLNLLKGQGLANTDPKILMKDEIETAEFEIWLTPLGRTELQTRLAD